MADKSPAPNALSARGQPRSVTVGDVPERLRRRYFVEAAPAEARFYLDARSASPVFLDRGKRLISFDPDPNAVRDMTTIAAHRGWRVVEARGAADFRREAWLAGRTAGLEVLGYRPTERDLQDLDRRLAAPARAFRRDGPSAGRAEAGAEDRLRVVEAVVQARVRDPQLQAGLMARARTRVAGWLERGAQFAPLRPTPERDRRPHPSDDRPRNR